MSSLPGVMPGTDVGSGLVQARPIRLAEVETYRGFEELAHASPARLVITTARLEGVPVRLASPVQIELSGDADAWIAENATLDLFGNGASREDAIRIFIERFEHFLSYYTRLSQDEVGGNGVRLKKLYDDLAGRNAGQDR